MGRRPGVQGRRGERRGDTPASSRRRRPPATSTAAAFGAAAGSSASNAPNAKLLAALSPQLTAAADENAVVDIAYMLENAAASTYLFALGALTSREALQLTASILPVESQHAVVLGSVLGKPATDYVPGFETTDAAVDPTKYPIS